MAHRGDGHQSSHGDLLQSSASQSLTIARPLQRPDLALGASSEMKPSLGEIRRRWVSSSPIPLRPEPQPELPLRGFMQAHRRLCRFSDEKDVVLRKGKSKIAMDGATQSSSSGAVEDPLLEEEEEGRSGWVKRLRMGEGGEERMVGSSYSLARSLQERRNMQRRMMVVQEAAEEVEGSPWIRRWRKSGGGGGEEEEKKKMEGHLFPSVAAMALVGKAISNFRPCKFQKRGSSLVWNTDYL